MRTKIEASKEVGSEPKTEFYIIRLATDSIHTYILLVCGTSIQRLTYGLLAQTINTTYIRTCTYAYVYIKNDWDVWTAR